MINKTLLCVRSEIFDSICFENHQGMQCMHGKLVDSIISQLSSCSGPQVCFFVHSCMLAISDARF